MSFRDLSGPNKGKGIAKTRRKRYVLRIPSAIVPTSTPTSPNIADTHSAHIQSPSLALVSMSSPSPSIPTMVATPHPTMVPTPPPTTIPTPSIVMVPTPSPPIPQLSTHTGPSHVVAPLHTTFIPSISSIPSPVISNPSNPPYSAVEVDPLLYDRPMIKPYGQGFVPSRVASQAITMSIKQQFMKPWPTWGAIPPEDKDIFWQRFKMKVQWRPEHESQIQKTFHAKASHRLSEMFRDARIAGKRPYWVGEDVCYNLLVHWNSPLYRNKCATAKKNRASKKVETLHTGGFITTHDHVICMEEIETKLSQAKSEQGSCSDASKEHNNDDVARNEITRTQYLVEVVGEKNKEKLYGAGQLTANYTSEKGILKHQLSSFNCSNENIENLMQRLEEREQAFEHLSRKFQSLEKFVMEYLIPYVQNHFQHQSDLTPSQQQPAPVQPTPIQESQSQQQQDLQQDP